MPAKKTENKKLYRSKSDRFISGVCGGIANYFNIDSNLVRVLFVILSFAGGVGIILYIAAIIILPENPHEEDAPSHSVNTTLIIGFILVVIGGILLLRQMGNFYYFRLFDISFSTIWGIMLIGVGIVLLFQTNKKSADEKGVSAQEEIKAQNEHRLYRSKNDRMISGVCGGIGEYFNIDPSFVRIAWVLATLFSVGIGILIYILLIFILPEKSAEHRS